MRNSVNIEVTYYDKGEEKKENIKISFINQKVLDWYSEFMGKIGEVAERWADIKQKLALLKETQYTKDKKRYKELKKEIEELSELIKSDEYTKLIDERIKLTLYILEINGYDGILYDEKKWYYNIEPDENFRFLDEAINKGEAKKK